MNCEEHGSMNCREFTDFINAYLEGELSDDQKAIFERHLSLCPNCDHYMDSYKATVELTKSLCDEEAPAPPAEVPEQLIQAILKARKA